MSLALPTAEKSSMSAFVSSSGVSGEGQSAVMPMPTLMGRLGMMRMTRGATVKWLCIEAMLMPADIDTMRDRSRRCRQASSITLATA